MGKESKNGFHKIFLKKAKNVELSGDLRKVLDIKRSAQVNGRRKNNNFF